MKPCDRRWPYKRTARPANLQQRGRRSELLISFGEGGPLWKGPFPPRDSGEGPSQDEIRYRVQSSGFTLPLGPIDVRPGMIIWASIRNKRDAREHGFPEGITDFSRINAGAVYCPYYE